MNIQLTALRDDDAEAMARLANNKKIWDNVRDRMPHPYALKDAKAFINLTKKERPQVSFGIIFEGVFCGVIGMIVQGDIYRKSAEMGYWIGEPYWGKGIATEAVKQVLKYGFEVLNMERIYAAAFEYNVGSMKVLEKNGFIKEGIARKAVYKNKHFYDEHRFGKLKND